MLFAISKAGAYQRSTFGPFFAGCWVRKRLNSTPPDRCCGRRGQAFKKGRDLSGAERNTSAKNALTARAKRATVQFSRDGLSGAAEL